MNIKESAGWKDQKGREIFYGDIVRVCSSYKGCSYFNAKTMRNVLVEKDKAVTSCDDYPIKPVFVGTFEYSPHLLNQ